MLKAVFFIAMMLAIISANVVSSTGPGARSAPPVQRLPSLEHESVQGSKKLSKDGRRNQKILKNEDMHSRILYMNDSLKVAGKNTYHYQQNIEALHGKLEKVEKIPNTIKGRIRSFLPTTPENKLRKERKNLHQELRQENKNLQKHRSYALNAKSDAHILHTSGKITNFEKSVTDRKAEAALDSQYE